MPGQPGYLQPDGTWLPSTTHLTITPVTDAVADDLIGALNQCADQVRGLDKAVADQQLMDEASILRPDPDSEMLFKILNQAGLGSGLPGAGMADVLALIEALPRDAGARLLAEFLARFVEPGTSTARTALNEPPD